MAHWNDLKGPADTPDSFINDFKDPCAGGVCKSPPQLVHVKGVIVVVVLGPCDVFVVQRIVNATLHHLNQVPS
ncbi:uncharacterized protein IUM83_16839 [Phytophthora cinnamomi]|uniref:uncharacterized protein n=1 Tax=Phytophthora cinnamomi TaxID=4785 RepID=UPI00355AA2F0|nr:hypothetical protein IUM83_16839 [Phytophthora cinnamomi]